MFQTIILTILCLAFGPTFLYCNLSLGLKQCLRTRIARESQRNVHVAYTLIEKMKHMSSLINDLPNITVIRIGSGLRGTVGEE